MAIRHEAKKPYTYADSSVKVSKAMPRKTAPEVGDYRVGDLVSFQTEQKGHKSKDRRQRWSPAARAIGFEGPQRKVGWVMCQGAPFCIATDRWRPANDAEILAYRYQHNERW